MGVMAHLNEDLKMLLPVQQIRIKTKNGRVFDVDLEKWSDTHFDVKIAAISLGPQLPANATFGPFGSATTANEAFEGCLKKLIASIVKLDQTDAIEEIDNLCNAELLDKYEQSAIVGNSIDIKVNGELKP